VLDPRRRGEPSAPSPALPDLEPTDLQPAPVMTTRLVADDRPAATVVSPARPSRSGTWLALGVLVAGAVTGVAFALNAPLLFGGRPSPPPAPSPTAPFVPMALPDAGPAELDASPIDTDSKAPGRRVRGPRGRPAAPPSSPDAGAGAPPVGPAAPTGVSLTIAAVPTGVATVDGRRAGRTPVTIRVAPGRHNVVVEGADGRRAVRTVYVGSDSQTVFLNLE
jgi:hypothetical protein